MTDERTMLRKRIILVLGFGILWLWSLFDGRKPLVRYWGAAAVGVSVFAAGRDYFRYRELRP